MIDLKVKRLFPDARLPEYATPGSACFDLAAHRVISNHGEHCAGVFQHQPRVFGTGLAFEVPENYVLLVFPRSGLAFKHGIRLSNCVAVIDSDYRGEVMISLTADGSDYNQICAGDRIAQAALFPIPQVMFRETVALSETVRGACGLGSTGT